MKPTLFRLIALVLSTVLGVAVSFSLVSHDISDELIPPVENSVPVESVHYPHLDRLVVISAPADGEFYLGKQRVELSQISALLMSALKSVRCGERVVYFKGKPTLKFETFALVTREAKRAHVDRIEVVLDKRKTGGSLKLSF